jgi:hypothetical protein
MNTKTLETIELVDVAIAAGKRHHYVFKEYSAGPVPKENYYDSFGWYVEVVEKLPERCHHREKVIRDAGVGIKGYLLIHEPKKDPEKISAPSIPVEKIKKGLGWGLGALVVAVGYVALAMATAPMMLVDPIAVLILEDDTWLAIEAWDE